MNAGGSVRHRYVAICAGTGTSSDWRNFRKSYASSHGACIVSFVDLDGIVGTSAPVGDSIFSNLMMVGGYWRIRDLIPRESPGPLKVNRCLTTALLNAA